MKFREFNLNKNILKALEEIKFIDCTEVQEKTFAYTFEKKDVCVQSQTGTGKTGAFLISVFQLFSENKSEENRALVITPTRELAEQVYQEALKIGKYMSYKIISVYGGVDIAPQIKKINLGANIIIGTPGRILDLYQKKVLNLKKINIAVCDEADKMFDMGFYQDINSIFKGMVPPEERLTYLFSATLDLKARQIAWKFMNAPIEIEMNSDEITVKNIDQSLYHVNSKEKLSLTLGLLKQQKNINCLIFTNTKIKAVEVALRLKVNGYKAKALTGNMRQNKRQSIINDKKEEKLPILVATDVAARGIHIDNLLLVINYDIPMHKENYVHRIGRTARAGKNGKAVSFVCEKFVYSLEAIEEYIEEKIPVSFAEDEMFMEDLSENLIFIPNKNGNNGNLIERKNLNKQKKMPYKIDKNKIKNRHNKAVISKDNLKENKKENAKRLKISSDTPLEQRIEFYKKKYGDDFKYISVTNNNLNKEEKKSTTIIQKSTLWEKIVSFFGRKK